MKSGSINNLFYNFLFVYFLKKPLETPIFVISKTPAIEYSNTIKETSD